MGAHAPSSSKPPDGARSDWTVDPGWSGYDAGEHRTWTTLYERQAAMLPGRACRQFLNGLDVLDLHGRGIPEFERLSRDLGRLTGWSVVAVPGLVPDDVFFTHLANRRFPAGRFIRGQDELDYLREPDVFHDVFGHVPMLTDPVFADFMQAYGRGGLEALRRGRLHNLARLYWYTVEFGLMETHEGLRIYGAGIVSSRAESMFALDDPSPNRIGFDLERVMRTPYRIDDFQQTYFVIRSLEALRETAMRDFDGLYRRLAALDDYAVDTLAASDRILNRGTQTHANARAQGGQ